MTQGRPRTKSNVVENCIVLDMSSLGRIERPVNGVLTWRCPFSGASVSTAAFQIDGRDEIGFALRLWYTLEETCIETQVPLTTTRPNFGGLRHWFSCPLERAAKRCGRQCRI